MTGTFRKVRSGDPLRVPAAAYNGFVDAALLARRFDADARSLPAPPLPHEHLVLVRNESSEDLDRFGILGIVGPIVEPGEEGNDDEFKRRATVAGAAITTTDEFVGRFVVAREPIRAGAIGWAVIRGVTPAIVDVVDEDHAHADTHPGEQVLRSGFAGAARVLWKEPGIGPRLSLVEIGPEDRDRFPVRLGPSHLIDGRTFGWLYEWQQVRLDADPFSSTFGQYARPGQSADEGWLASGDDPARLAFNRYEAHLSIIHEQGGGGEGFANGGACIIPGVLQDCPPPRAAVPMLHPIPEGVVVELRAERTIQGDTRFLFEALNPVILCEMDVPEWWYG